MDDLVHNNSKQRICKIITNKLSYFLSDHFFSLSNQKNATLYACTKFLPNAEIIKLLIQHGAKKEDISEKYLPLWEECKAKVSKKEIKKKKGKEEIQKELEIYETLGINKRISYFLAENNFPFIANNQKIQKDEEQEQEEEMETMDDKKLMKEMEKGKIPIGMPYSDLWNSFKETFKNIPLNVKQNKEKFDDLTIKENNMQQQLDKIEMERKKLIDSLDDIKTQKKKLKFLFENWEDLFNKFSFDSIEKIAHVEELTLNQINEQLEKNKFAFSSLYDENSQNPKLSLIFNCFGLSSETISLLDDMNSAYFRIVDVISECESRNITNAEVITDLESIKQTMMIQQPDFRHFSECCVCSCDNALDLVNLLKEHDLQLKYETLEKFNINGRRFLALNSKVISTYFQFSKEELLNLNKAIITIFNLHCNP